MEKRKHVIQKCDGGCACAPQNTQCQLGRTFGFGAAGARTFGGDSTTASSSSSLSASASSSSTPTWDFSLRMTKNGTLYDPKDGTVKASGFLTIDTDAKLLGEIEKIQKMDDLKPWQKLVRQHRVSEGRPAEAEIDSLVPAKRRKTAVEDDSLVPAKRRKTAVGGRKQEKEGGSQKD